jgi:hypothetical protein
MDVLARGGKNSLNTLPTKCLIRLIDMRGRCLHQTDIFSFISPEQRVRQDHPLRAIRAMAGLALLKMSAKFDAMCPKTGRASIPPEKSLRAQSIQIL